MRRPRVVLAGRPDGDGAVWLDPAAVHHLTTVLRLRPGASFVGADPDGRVWELELGPSGRDGCRARVRAELPSPPPVAVPVTLAVAVPRGGRMDWLVEKAVELGVAALQPLVADRSAPGGEAVAARLERWTRLARAAAAQCGRPQVPPVGATQPLGQALRAFDGPCLLADTATGAAPVAEAVRSTLPTPRLLLAVGPEGGWTPEERGVALTAGARPVGLGPRVLRVETAAVAALVLVIAALGGMEGVPA